MSIIRAALLLGLFCAQALPSQAPPLERFTVTADGHPLALWARRAARPRGVILLLHGRTWSALPDFDLQVPGESRSVLAALAARGYAAYALDARGYGATPRDRTGWLTPQRAADDVTAVLAWIAKSQPTSGRPVLLGWSYGSMVAQLVAQQHPAAIKSLILYGYPFDPDEHIVAQPDPPRPPGQHTTAADARSDFVSPAVTSPRMVAAYVVAALGTDSVRTDWRALEQWNQLNPARVHVPTLVLQGEHDPQLPAALERLFRRLGTPDKRRVTLMGGDHAALLEDTNPGFIGAVVGFMQRAAGRREQRE
jgi:pimeloyl-ACP methyl ester carboxylesterase